MVAFFKRIILEKFLLFPGSFKTQFLVAFFLPLCRFFSHFIFGVFLTFFLAFFTRFCCLFILAYLLLYCMFLFTESQILMPRKSLGFALKCANRNGVALAGVDWRSTLVASWPVAGVTECDRLCLTFEAAQAQAHKQIRRANRFFFFFFLPHSHTMVH